MQGFLSLSDAAREIYVARMLGLDPDAPHTWPFSVIHNIIKRAEKVAEESLLEDCRRMMGAPR